MPKPLTEPQERALQYLVESGHASTGLVAAKLYGRRQNSVASAMRVLDNLRSKELVTYGRMEGFRAYRWEPTEAGRKAVGPPCPKSRWWENNTATAHPQGYECEGCE